jgi:hypothetical protein
MTKTIKTIIAITTIVVGYYCSTIFYPNLYIIPLSKYQFLTTDNYEKLFITLEDTINIPIETGQECTIVSTHNLNICLPSNQIHHVKEFKNNTKMVITNEKNKTILLLSDTLINDFIAQTKSTIENTPYLKDHFNALGQSVFNNSYSLMTALLNITPKDISISRNAGENSALLTFLMLKSGEIKSFSKASNIIIKNHKGFQLGTPSTDTSIMVYLFDKTGIRYSIVFNNGYNQADINSVLSTIEIKPNNNINPTNFTYGLKKQAFGKFAGYVGVKQSSKSLGT